MGNSDLYSKGAAMRRKLLGDQRVAELSAGYETPSLTEFINVSTEVVFGALWARPGLDTKTRILICVVSDTATGRTTVLAEHIRIALREGWTENELTEVLLHLIGYVGAPFVRDAMLIASNVFAEAREQDNGRAAG